MVEAGTSQEAMRRRTTVLIADDHLVWRRGLRQVLEPSFEIVSEAGEGREAVSKTLAWRPDVVIMDIGLPGMDGLAAAREIKESLPATEVVFLSATAWDRDIYDAIQGGASGYLIKSDKAEAIVEAVQSAANGLAYLSPLVAKRVLQDAAKSTERTGQAMNSTSAVLTVRETAILRLLAEGLRQKEIAKRLCVSERTVGNQVSSIYRKLGVEDRAHAIVYAIKRGIARPGPFLGANHECFPPNDSRPR